MLCLTACSGDKGDTETEPSPEEGLPATEVCGGVLSGAAARDLETMMDAELFTQVDEAGADLQAFLETLKEPGARQERLCSIRAEGDWDAIRIDVGWELTVETQNADSFVEYAAGRQALSSPAFSAIIFSCPAPAGEEFPASVARATMGTDGADFDTDLLMSVLNAAARAVAEGLGCLAESGLPAGAPERLAAE
ncbi:hypothetical protein [Streptomyces sp. URMC 129]|uniref:hypothetical protein n=1 Tax=Streptomyces sp. URMC 129 TaxID=3423407 RepID=UPI003F1CFB43